jgi:hypothetical protein
MEKHEDVVSILSKLDLDDRNHLPAIPPSRTRKTTPKPFGDIQGFDG